MPGAEAANHKFPWCRRLFSTTGHSVSTTGNGINRTGEKSGCSVISGKVDGKSMESHSKVSLEVNKTQVLMKLSTKREVPDEVTSKLKCIIDKGLS
jgi:hypothetical protein